MFTIVVTCLLCQHVQTVAAVTQVIKDALRHILKLTWVLLIYQYGVYGLGQG